MGRREVQICRALELKWEEWALFHDGSRFGNRDTSYRMSMCHKHLPSATFSQQIYTNEMQTVESLPSRFLQSFGSYTLAASDFAFPDLHLSLYPVPCKCTALLRCRWSRFLSVTAVNCMRVFRIHLAPYRSLSKVPLGRLHWIKLTSCVTFRLRRNLRSSSK
jgi:hypothetical protein